MNDSKLIQLVRKLDKAEVRAFSRFIDSPYHNPSKRLVTFWNFIKSKAPDFLFKDTAIKKIYKTLFPKGSFDENRLGQQRFLLLKSLEEFLAIERFKNDDFRWKKEVADVYLDKALKDNFEKKYQDLHALFDDTFYPTSVELHQKLSLHHQSYFNEFNVKGDSYCNHFIESTSLLDDYYHRQKLIYTIEWLSRNLRYNHDIPQSISSYIKQLADTQSINKEGTSDLLEKSVNLLLNPSDEKFHRLKDQFFDQYKKIDSDTKNLLFRLLINYCINNGDNGKNITEEVFQLYEFGVKDGAIFYKRLMSNVTFINIVACALNLGKNDWIRSFLKKETYRMYEPQKELYQQYANALIFFHEKQYNDCMTLLSRLGKSDLIILEVPRRNLHIRAIFESYLKGQIHVKLLFAQLESYQKYLQRKSIISVNKRKAYQNFIRFMLRLIEWKEYQGTTEELIEFKQQLLLTEPFPNKTKNWLLCHLNRLIKKGGASVCTPPRVN